MIINAANVLDATLCRGEFRGCQVRFEILSIYNSLKIGFEPAKYMLFYHQSINQISDLHSALSSLCNILTCYCFYIIIEATFQNFSRLYNLYLPSIQILGFHLWSFFFFLHACVVQITCVVHFRKCQINMLFLLWEVNVHVARYCFSMYCELCFFTDVATCIVRYCLTLIYLRSSQHVTLLNK